MGGKLNCLSNEPSLKLIEAILKELLSKNQSKNERLWLQSFGKKW
jgi:hypothetical protein